MSEYGKLAAKVEHAELLIVAAALTQPEKWWPADELRAAAGVRGEVAMIAMTRLANAEVDGRLELDDHLRVRICGGAS